MLASFLGSFEVYVSRINGMSGGCMLVLSKSLNTISNGSKTYLNAFARTCIAKARYLCQRILTVFVTHETEVVGGGKAIVLRNC